MRLAACWHLVNRKSRHCLYQIRRARRAQAKKQNEARQEGQDQTKTRHGEGGTWQQAQTDSLRTVWHLMNKKFEPGAWAKIHMFRKVAARRTWQYSIPTAFRSCFGCVAGASDISGGFAGPGDKPRLPERFIRNCAKMLLLYPPDVLLALALQLQPILLPSSNASLDWKSQIGLIITIVILLFDFADFPFGLLIHIHTWKKTWTPKSHLPDNILHVCCLPARQNAHGKTSNSPPCPHGLPTVHVAFSGSRQIWRVRDFHFPQKGIAEEHASI